MNTSLLKSLSICFLAFTFATCSETPELSNNYDNCDDLYNSVFKSQYFELKNHWGEPDEYVVSDDNDFITCTWNDDKVHVRGVDAPVVVTFKAYLLAADLGYTPGDYPIKVDCGGMELEAK